MKARRGARQMFVVWCGAVLALGMAAASATTIQEARNLGAGATGVTVRGIVTATQFGQPIHIQDATAAIAVYGASGPAPAVGDEVQVTGDIVDFSSLLEFAQGCTLEILSSGNPLPEPLVLTTDQIAADATDTYESKLVRVEDVLTFSTGNFAGNSNYVFENLDGAIQVRIDRDTELVGTPIPASNVNITGILGQYRNAYQLQPRTLADIEIAGTDFDPPTVQDVTAEDATHLVVTYNEPVDPATAANPLNYAIDQGVQVVAAAMVLGADAQTQVRLTVSAMAVGLYQLTIANVEDLSGNVLEFATRYFGSGVLPIATAKRSLDGDFIPDLVGTGTRVTVEGIVTSTNYSATGTDLFIQDDSGAVALFTFAFQAAVAMGDRLRVTGTIDNYRGKAELVPGAVEDIVTVATGQPLPAPVPLTLPQFIGASPEQREAWDGMLVRFDNVEIDPLAAWPAAGADATIEVYDPSDPVTYFLAMRLDKETDIDGQEFPADVVAILGNIDQFDANNCTPCDAGYQLRPRAYADFLGLQATEVEITGFAIGPNPGEVTITFVSSRDGLANLQFAEALLGEWAWGPTGVAPIPVAAGVPASFATVVGGTARFYRVTLE